MITIDVVGASSKSTKRLLEEAASFYLRKLLGRKSRPPVLLTIRLRKNLLQKAGAKADCFLIQDEDELYEYEVRIDSGMNLGAILRCLAHEMIHVKQYLTGEMKDDQGAWLTTWKKKTVDTRKVDYYDLPWEIEAHGRELGLYETFVTHKRYQKKKWYRDMDFA